MNDWRSLLYMVLSTEHGLVLESNDVEGAMKKLNAERLKDEALRDITILQSPDNPDQIWLVRGETRKPGRPREKDEASR